MSVHRCLYKKIITYKWLWTVFCGDKKDWSWLDFCVVWKNSAQSDYWCQKIAGLFYGVSILSAFILPFLEALSKHMASISQSRITDAKWCLFSTTSQTFGPIGQISQINFGVFPAKLAAPILALLVPCPWFPEIQT